MSCMATADLIPRSWLNLVFLRKCQGPLMWGKFTPDGSFVAPQTPPRPMNTNTCMANLSLCPSHYTARAPLAVSHLWGKLQQCLPFAWGRVCGAPRQFRFCTLPSRVYSELGTASRAARGKIFPVITAVAGGFAGGLAAHEIMKWVFKWVAPAPLYGALVVFIGIATWLFVKLSEDR